DDENHIYGGSNAKIDKYQYIASLGIDSVGFGGGTLNVPQFILTYGHCLEYHSTTSTFHLIQV
ncbi:hypothetical protein PHMEG_00035977, partial [Phytophthora megakarya]